MDFGTAGTLLALIAALSGVLGAGFVYFRRAAGDAWRDVAEGRAELLDQRERELGELRVRLAALEARPDVDSLAHAITTLGAMVDDHDTHAEARWAETQALVAGILERVDQRIASHDDAFARVLGSVTDRLEGR